MRSPVRLLGGCPKHRFATAPSGEPGLHYLCAGYKQFFLHIRKYLQAMATLLENDLPVSHVMQAVKGPLVIRRGDKGVLTKEPG
jgi:uncharacterized protein